MIGSAYQAIVQRLSRPTTGTDIMSSLSSTPMPKIIKKTLNSNVLGHNDKGGHEVLGLGNEILLLDNLGERADEKIATMEKS